MEPKRRAHGDIGTAPETVSQDEQLCRSALMAHPMFGALDAGAVEQIASNCQMATFSAGEIITREGTVGDTFYLITQGLAEVTSSAPDGDDSKKACLASLGPGDHFGEVALLSLDGKVAADVRAITDVRAVTISSKAFSALMMRYPAMKRALEASAAASLTVKFVKQATPFARLGPDKLQDLVRRLKPMSIDPGTEVIRQGDTGDACYLLRSGEMEVVAETHDEKERSLARLEAGAIFGEIGLLVGARRNATVRATAPSEVLALSRKDFLAVVPEHGSVEHMMFELIELRRRPRRAEAVTEHRRPTLEGDSVVVLRHEQTSRYYQLSAQGWFVWQRLDGDTTLKDLTIDFFREYHEFAPDKIAQIIAGLAHAGFIEDAASRPAGDHPAQGPGALLHHARHLLKWRVTLLDVDGTFDALHRNGGFVAFLVPVQLLCIGLCLLGVIAAFSAALGAVETITQSSPLVLACLVPFKLLQIVLHESGHALAVKHAGRTVRGAGVGWYWFSPVAFVDTTDAWLASPRERMTVSLAGPAVDAVVGSIAAIVAWLSTDLAQLIAMQLAVVCYASVLANLNPLLEYDGYHALSDMFDEPRLRRGSLLWLRQAVSEPGSVPRDLRRHRSELLYVLASIAYITVIVVLTVSIFRLAFGK